MTYITARTPTHAAGEGSRGACEHVHTTFTCCAMHVRHACHMHEPGTAARIQTCDVWWAAHVGAARIGNTVWCICLSKMVAAVLKHAAAACGVCTECWIDTGVTRRRPNKPTWTAAQSRLCSVCSVAVDVRRSRGCTTPPPLQHVWKDDWWRVMHWLQQQPTTTDIRYIGTLQAPCLEDLEEGF